MQYKELRLTGMKKTPQQSSPAGGVIHYLWQQRLWWLLPLLVLLLLIGVLYLLGHMSAADPEMYPTTLLNDTSHFRAC